MRAHLRMTAVIAATTLALAAVTGASSPPRPHAPTAGVSGGIRHLAPDGVPLTTARAVDQALAGTPQAPTVYVSGGPTTGTFYGIIWLLYNSQSHGISDNAAGSTANQGPDTGTIVNILENVSGGIITWGVIQASKGVYKWVKKYIYKGKHVSLNAGDGLCMADFGKGLTDYLANCGDKHGIYWTVSTAGKMWDTYTGGMQIASSLNNGTKLYTWYPAKDWYTWTYADVCSASGC
jgi:hypothetical protein